MSPVVAVVAAAAVVVVVVVVVAAAAAGAVVVVAGDAFLTALRLLRSLLAFQRCLAQIIDLRPYHHVSFYTSVIIDLCKNDRPDARPSGKFTAAVCRGN